jgi:hypothetical protein
MKPNAKKKGKYADELEKLRELNAIKQVLKKSDIENAALTNTSKDSETVSDNAIDNMLDQLNLEKNSNRDLEIIESLSSPNRKNMGTVKRPTPTPKHKSKAHYAAPSKPHKSKGKKR